MGTAGKTSLNKSAMDSSESFCSPSILRDSKLSYTTQRSVLFLLISIKQKLRHFIFLKKPKYLKGTKRQQSGQMGQNIKN